MSKFFQAIKNKVLCLFKRDNSVPQQEDLPVVRSFDGTILIPPGYIIRNDRFQTERVWFTSPSEEWLEAYRGYQQEWVKPVVFQAQKQEPKKPKKIKRNLPDWF